VVKAGCGDFQQDDHLKITHTVRESTILKATAIDISQHSNKLQCNGGGGCDYQTPVPLLIYSPKFRLSDRMDLIMSILEYLSI
jgi:hypothetical protein